MIEKDPVLEVLYVHQDGARIAELMLQWAMVWTANFRFLAEARDFSPLYRVETSSWVHPASFPMRTGCSLPEGKAAMA
jgi:hypothetical protein